MLLHTGEHRALLYADGTKAIDAFKSALQLSEPHSGNARLAMKYLQLYGRRKKRPRDFDFNLDLDFDLPAALYDPYTTQENLVHVR